MSYLPAALRRQMRERAADRCEYCMLAEEDAYLPHEPDHIIAEKHGGTDKLENLALACFDCNRFKGSNIASLDPVGGELTPLFNPRMQKWSEHFEARGGEIIPLTAVGRVTERILRLNLPARVEVREMLAEMGDYPGGSP